MNDYDENYLKKCITCKHCYVRKDDDYIYCRKRNGKCDYKEKEVKAVEIDEASCKQGEEE